MVKFVFKVIVKHLLNQAVVKIIHAQKISNALWALVSRFVLHLSTDVKKATCVTLACALKIRGVQIVQMVTDVTGSNVFQNSIALLLIRWILLTKWIIAGIAA